MTAAALSEGVRLPHIPGFPLSCSSSSADDPGQEQQTAELGGGGGARVGAAADKAFISSANTGDQSSCNQTVLLEIQQALV